MENEADMMNFEISLCKIKSLRSKSRSPGFAPAGDILLAGRPKGCKNRLNFS